MKRRFTRIVTAVLAVSMMYGSTAYAAGAASSTAQAVQETGANITLSDNSANAGAYVPMDSEYEQFFADSVLIGDSVSQGFENYAMQMKNQSKEAGQPVDPVLGTMKFLTSSGYSLLGAFDPVSATSKHPRCMGQQRPVWESVKLLGAKHIYMFLGINDLGGKYHITWKYKALIKKIKEVNPDCDFTILSATPTVKDGAQKGVNNQAIRELNVELKKMAQENGWNYIDIASRVSDAEGNLKQEYNLDNYIHENAAGYAVWTQTLKDYAAPKIYAIRQQVLAQMSNAQ